MIQAGLALHFLELSPYDPCQCILAGLLYISISNLVVTLTWIQGIWSALWLEANFPQVFRGALKRHRYNKTTIFVSRCCPVEVVFAPLLFLSYLGRTGEFLQLPKLPELIVIFVVNCHYSVTCNWFSAWGIGGRKFVNWASNNPTEQPFTEKKTTEPAFHSLVSLSFPSNIKCS